MALVFVKKTQTLSFITNTTIVKYKQVQGTLKLLEPVYTEGLSPSLLKIQRHQHLHPHIAPHIIHTCPTSDVVLTQVFQTAQMTLVSHIR